MTNIRIEIDAPTAEDAREQMVKLLGAVVVPGIGGAGGAVPSGTTPITSSTANSTEPTGQKPLEGEVLTADDSRPHGKPGTGRAKRNKAELAEDGALEKLAISAGIPMEKVNAVIGQVGRAKAIEGLQAKIAQGGTDEPQANISTGENRVGPEDDAETQAQDAADEAAEHAGKPLTIDDVKGAMGLYVEKHGMPATQEDGPAIFADALGTPPEGNAAWKLTLVAAAGQEAMKKAAKAFTDAAAASGRYKKAA